MPGTGTAALCPNNPLRYTDPTGYAAICAAFAPNPITYVGCQIVTEGPRVLQQVQSLTVQYGPAVSQALQPIADKLPALVEGAGQTVNHIQQALSYAGNTAPGNFDPNKWDPSRFKFKSSSLRSHFERHVLNKPKEAWEEVLGVSRAELEAARSDPAQLARLQEAYVQVGQQTSRAGNYIGVQAQGQQVFVDTSNRVVAIVQGDRFLSLYRITKWEEFVLSMKHKGLQLAPGVTFEALQKAMGY